LLVLPSDHVVRDDAAFRAAIAEASAAAEQGALVTFGIVPTGPETAFGYIHATGADLASASWSASWRNPTQRPRSPISTWAGITGTAACSCSGRRVTCRNSSASAPTCWRRRVPAWERASHDGDFIRLDRDAFAACAADSIDYAVMERTDTAQVLPVDIGWNDVGSWSALWDVARRDADGNATLGDVIAIDSRNSYVHARRLVALVGVDDLVVVDTDDAVLVARKDRVQQVKDVVARLKHEQRSHAALHREVHRPWGSYDSVDVGPRFQVKRIKVKPGARLSLQSHTQRAEHWIVVSGTARVTRDNDVFELHANQSTYIPIGAKHRSRIPGRRCSN
jgi:mannose-1-phosphate guanylyltransferase/mannose-6-phosphate isomerase